MQWRRVALIGGACLLVGCSLLTSLDGLGPGDGATLDGTLPDVLAGDGPANNDAPANDATTDGGITDAPTTDASDGNANLVTNPSFELGSGGCGGNWGNGYGDTFTRVSPGRTGNSACDVCIQGSGASYQLNAINPIPVQAGSYYAEAWLTTPDGGVATQAGIQVYYTGDGGITGCTGSGSNYCQGNIFTPTGVWSSSSTSFLVTGSGTISVDLHSYAGTANSCFVVDDVAVYAQ